MIEIKHLSKTFGTHTVLKDISLTIPQGETVALIGPSGSGKSTLLRCINFLETPDSGKVIIDEEQVTKENAGTIAKKVGMVFQQFNLFPHKTILENITYAPIHVLKKNPEVAKKEAFELLQKVGLTDKAMAYPQSLSGGQKQRVAIARTLAMHPEVILFDEPTSALDPEMVKEVLEVISSLAHTGITLLIVTHEMGFARKLADRILFLDQGSIVEDAPPDVFFQNPKSARAQRFLEKVL